MKALLISIPAEPAPQRFWTNLGPKTIEEILAELNKKGSRLNYGMLCHEAKDAVEDALMERDSVKETRARQAKKARDKKKWDDNKRAAAQRQDRRRR